MALNRKFLTALGIEEDKIEQILDAYTDMTSKLNNEMDQYKADAKKTKQLQKEIDELNEAMKNGERSPYKVKYEAKVEEFNDLKKEFDDYKADVSAKELESKKSNAYKELLKESGVSGKRIDSVLRVTDLSKIELDNDGKIKDPDGLKKNIKEEWSDFIVTESKQGATVSNPPSNTGGGKKTKEEILAIKDTAERQQAMLQNKDLFI